MSINCLIVDDNKIARITLAQLAGQVNDLLVVAECGSAMEAYNVLQETVVDLLLLDIEMPGMTGLELSRNLGEQPPIIIFTTSKKEYAAEVFDLNVADYIVKPLTPSRFLQAINKARQLVLSKNERAGTETEEAFIFIRDSQVVRRLMLADLLYAEAMGDYVKLHTPLKVFTAHTSLKALEERLPRKRFVRVHRSFLVALDRIDTLQEGLLVVGGALIPVADSYRNVLNKRMNVI